MSESTELAQLRSVLRQAVKACRKPVREIENALGIGHGNLASLLDGSLELRLRHLLGFARFLSVAPQDFLEIAFPRQEAGAKYRLHDWLGLNEPKPSHAAKPNGPPEDLPALLKQAIREEFGGDFKEAVRAVLREEQTAQTQKPRRSG
jgi:hypothetical protein